MSSQYRPDDIASLGTYVGQRGGEGKPLDAEDWLDSLFADSPYQPARLSQLIYPQRSRRVASDNPDRLIAREGVL